MKLDSKTFVLGFIIGLCFWGIAWALTVDQIWQSVYDPINQAIRLNQVAP